MKRSIAKEAPLFNLQAVEIDSPCGPLLRAFDWEIKDDGVTVLMGPAGTGKSALLRGLAREPRRAGWRYGGTWLHRGRELAFMPREAVAWVPQVRVSDHQGVGKEYANRWREALASRADVLLLDEPTRGCSADEARQLIVSLRARSGAAVVVTHDLEFARAVADRVALLCAGCLVAEGETSLFFAAPPNELAARFVRQGNCWPAAPAFPEPPRHFHWVLSGQLAGMARPGLLRDIDTDLLSLVGAGVRLLVTLTEDPLPQGRLRAAGLECRHLPVPDMGVPPISPTATLCGAIERTLHGGGGVAIHCHGGLGRTGTILACVLVWLGRPPADAIAEVRQVVPGYIQNGTQADFVHRFSVSVGTVPPTKKGKQ